MVMVKFLFPNSFHRKRPKKCHRFLAQLLQFAGQFSLSNLASSNHNNRFASSQLLRVSLLLNWAGNNRFPNSNRCLNPCNNQ